MFRAQHDDSGALDLLPEWREPVSSGRILRAGVGSLVVHVAAAAVLLSLPTPSGNFHGVVTMDLRKATHLVAPRILDPTQKEPNKEKVVKPELDIRSALPPAPPKARTFRPPAPAGAASQPSASLPDAPQIQAALMPPQIDGVAPPLPKSIEKPKITFEDVSPAPIPGPRPEHPVIPNPSRSVDDLTRAASQPGGGGGLPSATGDGEASSVRTPQLLSDPQGVDFKPYLLQVLASVRRNWLLVIPQDARMGRRGQTVIQFIIDKHGGVPKVVIATPSGIAAFDRAAVAGISASYPFPPLPTGYKGDEIRLQLAFSYNLPSASK